MLTTSPAYEKSLYGEFSRLEILITTHILASYLVTRSAELTRSRKNIRKKVCHLEISRRIQRRYDASAHAPQQMS